MFSLNMDEHCDRMSGGKCPQLCWAWSTTSEPRHRNWCIKTSKDVSPRYSTVLVGGWALPLWKMMEWKSVGMMTFPKYLGIHQIHVPNYQTGIHFIWVNYITNLKFSDSFPNPNHFSRANRSTTNRDLILWRRRILVLSQSYPHSPNESNTWEI